MTAFSNDEHNMLRGLWGELETMNRSLTRLVELLENQEQPPVNTDIVQQAHQVRDQRRPLGLCMSCGASRANAGKGCYELPISPDDETMTWMMHSWPEDEPQ